MDEFKRAYSVIKAYVNREFDRIQGLERDAALQELDSPIAHRSETREVVSEVVVDASLARRYLGVDESANFETIRAKYDDLVKRSNPSQFPEGSAEQFQAIELQRRIHRAYSILAEEISVTEKRFRSLEIE